MKFSETKLDEKYRFSKFLLICLVNLRKTRNFA
jgi:hypothetical protein